MGLVKQLQCLVGCLCFATLAAVLWYKCLVLSTEEDHYMAVGAVALVLTVMSVIALDIARHRPAESHTLKTMLTQYLAYQFMSLLGRYHSKKMNQYSKNVAQYQEQLLLNEYIRPNADTDFGRKYQFDSITSREEFRRCVPLTTYDDYIPYVERIQNNAADVKGVLTNDPVVFLAVTSGSTGKNKIIPVGKSIVSKGRAMFSLVFNVLSQYENGAGFPMDRIARIGFKPVVRRSPSGLTMAPISYHMKKNIVFYLVPNEVYEIQDEQTALYVEAVLILAERELGILQGFMSTLVWAFWRVIEQNWSQICDDIEMGQISSSIALEPHIRRAVEIRLKGDGARATELRHQFKQGYSGIFKRVWPGIKCIEMFSTGGFQHHGRLLIEGPLRGCDIASTRHGASEGMFGIQFYQNPKDPLHVQYETCLPVYQEFLPVTKDNCIDAAARTLFPEELRLGECYEIVVTSPMGLYRYRMGDVIKVVGFRNQCPIYEFQYRTGHVLNTYWEKTPENVVYEAIQSTMSNLNLSLVDYTTTEDVALHTNQEYQANSSYRHYVLFIEANNQNGLAANLDKDSKSQFDKNLCERMDLYATLRQGGSIGTMNVIEVMPGTFRALRTQMLARFNTSQLKMPRVVRDPELLASLLSARLREIEVLQAETSS